jgi:hypothetical protein
MPAYYLAPAERDPQQFNNAIQQLMQGRVNCTGTVTLATGSATTLLKVPTAGVGTGLIMFPLTANGGAEVASGNLFVPLCTVSGQFTIHHTNSGTTLRSFFWANFG